MWVHPAGALLDKLLDPGLQAGRDIIGDVDDHIEHQPQVDHTCVLVALQLLPSGIDLDIEANGV